MNTSAFGVEKATLIRYPATANLMVDSADRNFDVWPTPYNFAIQKNQPLINGFFSRIGATEVVLDWCEYNIPTSWNGIDNLNKFQIDLSGTGGNTHSGVTYFDIPPGVYTIGDCMDAMVGAINDASGDTGVSATVSKTKYPGWVSIVLSGGVGNFVNAYDVPDNLYLGVRLGISTFDGVPSDAFIFDCPDLRLTRYLDIVCENLTQVQDVQDATTSTTDRNVVVRWYMDEDVPEPIDQYGFPILMGYDQFHRRRLYNPPKQIKWEQNLQVGNLAFSCYDDKGRLMTPTQQGGDTTSEVSLTLQLSEG